MVRKILLLGLEWPQAVDLIDKRQATQLDQSSGRILSESSDNSLRLIPTNVETSQTVTF